MENRLQTPVTLFKGAFDKEPKGVITLEELLNQMLDAESPLVQLSEKLQTLRQTDRPKYDEVKQRELPAFIIGRWSRAENSKCEQYVNLQAHDLDALPANQVDDMLQSLRVCPYIFAAFPSPSGEGIRALIWCDCNEGTHKQTYLSVAQYLSNFLGIETDRAIEARGKAAGLKPDGVKLLVKQTRHVDSGTNNTSRIWFYSHVPSERLYLKIDSDVFTLKLEDLKESFPEETPRTLTEEDRIEACRQKVGRQSIPSGRNNFVYAFAAELVQHGVSEARALSECSGYEESDFSEAEIKKTVASAYRQKTNRYSDAQILSYLKKVNGGAGAPTGSKAPPSNDTDADEDIALEEDEAAHLNKRAKLEAALARHYEFRRNSLTKIPEYRPKVKPVGAWRRMTDDDLFSIERRLQLAGYSYASEVTIRKIISSDFSPAYHPIHAFFNGLPEYDGEDHIAALAATIKTLQGEVLFAKYLKKWLTGVVANALIEKFCANHLCLILIGQQGDNKSKWISNLYPGTLLDYCKNGGMDPDEKDSLISAAENLIINMDDYFADISAKKVNSLKGFITLDVIKIRRPYGRFDEVLPKICSFIGSTNESQFLYDDTGDRRFLCFEVESMDLAGATAINMDQVWAQAKHLFQTGFTYWVPKEEAGEQQKINETYRVVSYELEMVERFFKVPIAPEQGEFYTTSSIANYLQGYTKANLSLKRIGQAMKLLQIPRVSRRDASKVPVWGYYLIVTASVPEHEEALRRRGEAVPVGELVDEYDPFQ